MDKAIVIRPVFEPGRRIIAVSDIHGNLPFFLALMEKVRLTPDDILILLGDLLEKGQDSLPLLRHLMALSRTHTVYPVCGNCDGPSDLPAQRILTLEGKRVLLCHGHTYGVKSGMGGAIAAARTQGVDALLFGHTHEAFCDLLEDLWVMNPGSIGSLLSPTYGIIRITEAGMVCYTEAY